MTDRNLPLALCLGLMLSGCATLAPPLPQAQPQLPQQWPGEVDAVSDGVHAADLGWREFFVDARLQQLIAQALENNRDLRVAVLNVERARAQHRIRQADRVPNLGGGVQMQRSGGNEIAEETVYSASAGVSGFELDLFGRVRSLSEAALQQYFAQAENRRAAHIALVAEVANVYLALATDHERLRIAQATLDTYEQSQRLTEQRHEFGAVSGLEVAQARTQTETARAAAAGFRGAVAQDRNLLQLLVGAPLDPALLPQGMSDVAGAAPVPFGLPADMLLRRPDVAAAERVLRGANANIGAARAAFFPSITLTGDAGHASTELGNLFDGGLRWSFIPRISIPIFSGGRLRANLAMSQADRDIALANYELAIQNGFREVADGLQLGTALVEQRVARERLLEAARTAERLSQARYQAGRDSYLVRLDAQRTLYNAEQGLLGARQQEQANRIALYRALGGGWVEQGSTP